jgi:phosphomannomutase
VLTTLVTTPLLATMARAHGLDVVDDLLVGFKHHAGMMAEQPEKTLIFGCEESHGYVRGDDIRDKDGAIAALLLAECAAVAHAEAPDPVR